MVDLVIPIKYLVSLLSKDIRFLLLQIIAMFDIFSYLLDDMESLN